MNLIDVISYITTFAADQNRVLHIILIIFLIPYGLYAFILTSQIRSLSTTLQLSGTPSLLRLLSLIHAIIACGLLILTILIF